MSFRDHESLIMIDPCTKYDIIMPMSKQTDVRGSDTKTCKNPYKFDLDFKGQCIGIMNTTLYLMVMHTHIWYANVKAKKSYGPKTNLQRETE